MKELSIEEKAKRFDEAINTIRNLVKAGLIYEDAAIQVFPQLKESEDEIIRGEIISALKFANVKGVYDKHIAWLEKQREQNPAQSEEDAQYIDDTLALLSFGCSTHSVEEVKNWLKYLKDRVQPRQEWSEEDDKKRKSLIKGLEGRMGFGWACDPFSREEYIDWLKSLRPQSTWKLNEEQIKKELNKAANEWERKASFSPIAMVMDGDRPIGTKQHITSHADSFKAGVDWLIKKLREE